MDVLSEPLRVFIGYDKRQPIAFNTLAHSIWCNASRPLSVTRLNIDVLPMQRKGLTEFTYSRFLVPYLSNFDGFSLFIDSDFICDGDIFDLLLHPILDSEANVLVCQNKIKFEWPSLMLFNNRLCTKLTPEFVDNKDNILFDFAWADKIGELPLEWNHLSNYDNPEDKIKAIHYTQGIPVWAETKDSNHSNIWFKYFKNSTSTVKYKELMGNSVHNKHVQERLSKLK